MNHIFTRLTIAVLAAVVLLGAPVRAQDGELDPEVHAKVESLLESLASDEWSERERATKMLIELGNSVGATAIGPMLIEAKRSADDVEVKRRLSRVLNETGAWTLDPEEVANRVGQKMAQFKGQEVFTISARDPEDVYLQHDLHAEIQSLIEWSEEIGALLGKEIGSTSDETYRANLVFLAGEIDAKGAAGAVREVLTSADAESSQAIAAWALGRFGRVEDVEALHEAAGSESALVRMYSIYAIGRVRDGAAVEMLIEFLGDDDRQVRQVAIYGLQRLTGKSLRYNPYHPASRRAAAIERWKGWWEENGEGFEFPPLAASRRNRYGNGMATARVEAVAPRVVEAVPARPVEVPAVVEDHAEAPDRDEENDDDR